MRKRLLVAGLLLIAGVLLAAPAGKVYADTINYNNVIDDAVFDNKNTMTAAQIDAFLNSFPNSCISTNKGFSSPDPTGFNPSQGFLFGGNVSAGTVIYHAAQAYEINPQVLITTLQKEQSLVSGNAGCYPSTPDKNASFTCNLYNNDRTYNCTNACPYGGGCIPIAVGYGCPGRCNADQEGFSNQIIRAAWRFSFDRHRAEGQADWYIMKTNWDNTDDAQSCYDGPMTQGTWRVCPSGGTSYYDGYYTTKDPATVHIDNGATAALYHYTPFKHGQELFFNIFTGWFGSTQQYNSMIKLSKPLTTSSTNGEVYTDETLTASYEVSNTASYPVNVGGLGICARINNQWYDFGFKDQNTIAANGTLTVTYSKKLDRSGSLYISVCSYNETLGGWAGALYPYADGTVVRTAHLNVHDNPLITSSVAFSPSTPVAGEPVTATISLHNASASSVEAGRIVFAVRGTNNHNYDFPSSSLTIPAGATVSYNKTTVFDRADSYTYYIADNKNSTWLFDYPKTSTGVTTKGTLTVKDNPLITSGISITPSSPAAGQLATASFTVTNSGTADINIGRVFVAARDPSGKNVDFPSASDVVVPANGTYTYSQSRIQTKPGTYSTFIADFRNGGWDMSYPKSANKDIARSKNFVVHDNPLLTTGLTVSPSNPVAGEEVTANFVITNDSEASVNLGLLVVAARDPSGKNVDLPGDEDVVVAAHSTYTYTKSRVFDADGSYTFFIANLRGSTWSTTYPTAINNTINRGASLTIKANPVLTTNLSVSPSNPKVGDTVSAAVTIRNDSPLPVNIGHLVIAARDPQGKNVDFPSDLTLTIPANSSVTYTKSRAFSVAGSYKFFLADFRNNVWSTTYPESENSTLLREIRISIGT